MLLRPPRPTRTDTLFPYTTLFRSVRAILREKLAITLNLVRYDRARADDAHVACKDILQLRQFIKARLAQYAADRGDPGIVRSEERRVGKECVSTCRSRWSPYH